MLSPRSWETQLSGAHQQCHLGGSWTRIRAGSAVVMVSPHHTQPSPSPMRHMEQTSGLWAPKVSKQFGHASTHPHACNQKSFSTYSLFHCQSSESPCPSLLPLHLYAHLACLMFFKRLKNWEVFCPQVFWGIPAFALFIGQGTQCSRNKNVIFFLIFMLITSY